MQNSTPPFIKEEFSAASYQTAIAWVDSMELSRPKKNLAKDFSDGVLLHYLCIGIGSPTNAEHKGKYSHDVSDFEIVIPKKVNHKGEFISHLIPHEYKRSNYADKNEANMDPEDKLHYHLPIKGTPHHIELWPHSKFISPGMIIESHTGNSQVKYNKVRESQCHYRGRIRGKDGPTSALSTCHGLAGVLHLNDGTYIIEPVDGHDHNSGEEHPHIVYKYDAGGITTPHCGTVAKHVARSVLQHSHSKPINERSSCNDTDAIKVGDEEKYFFVETLLVLDKSLILYHEEMEVEVYALTVMNMAASLFHEASLDVQLDIVIVRIIRLEDEEGDLNVEVSSDSSGTLDSFCEWQKEMNVGNDSHPNHHDVAVLLMKSDLCRGCGTTDHCDLMGMSKIGGVCTPSDQCAVCEDSGLRLGYVIAHELGHTLGMLHDGDGETNCVGVNDDNSTTVMNPSISMKVKGWSSCSRENLRAFLFGYLAGCLHDEPADHNYSIHDLLPGVMYDADAQCKAMVSQHATECDMGSTCSSLNCQVPGLPCMVTNVPPAPGTRCGENEWCYGRRCVEIGERPGAVEGGWGNWGPFGQCSRSCGSGIMTSTRRCNAPKPSNGGKYCVGDRKKHKVCAFKPCPPGEPTFRDFQCSKYNQWKLPEDGKMHTWKAHYVKSENPCTLLCINEDKIIVKFSPTVLDGTPCKVGLRDICVAGECKAIPCDLDLDSTAVEDACGICHGSGTECVVHKGTQYVKETDKELVKLIEIQSETRSIKLEHTAATMAYLVVKDFKGNTIISGRKLGVFKVPGSMAWLGMRRKAEEALYIPGPITEPLAFYVAAVGNSTIEYSYATKKDNKKEYVKGNYKWEFIDWNKCSTHCGPGNQVSRARCVELETGQVEDNYCNKEEKPAEKTRPCFDHTCTKRWLVGEWTKDCRECLFQADCYRTRQVVCVIPFGEGDGEVVILEDEECVKTSTKAKPVEKEKCPENPCGYTVLKGRAGLVEPETYTVIGDKDDGWGAQVLEDDEDGSQDLDKDRFQDDDIMYAREVDFQEIDEDPVERMSSSLKDECEEEDKRWRIY